MTTRRSARIRIQSGCNEENGSIQVPEVTSSSQIKVEAEDCDSTDLQVEQNLDEKKDINISIGNESSDSESETPEEVSFAKSKEVFMEESDAIRNAKEFLRVNKKRRVLSSTVLSAVSKQEFKENEQSDGEKEEVYSSIGTEAEVDVPRIRAVSLKSLHSKYELNEDVITVQKYAVKKSKFSKVKLGPAAQFLVKRD